MPYNSGMCLEFKKTRNRQVRPQRLCAPLLALLIAGPLSAATVYKTVDENGVVSYSDTAPAIEQEAEVMVIDVPAPQDSESAQERLDAMRETTDRMVADRQQREKHRAEMRKLQAESEPQVIEYGAPADSGGIYTGYYPYPVYRPRPTHPIARPPLRPRPPGYPPRGDIISPGHDYPASLIRRSYSPEVRAAFEK